MRMRWATVAVVVVVAATFALVIRPPLKEPALAHRLIRLQRAIDKNNVGFSGARPTFGELSEALRNRFRDAEAVDDANTRALAEILRTHGWPTEREVGREAVRAALNVVGRSRDASFQANAITLMDKAGVDHDAQYARLVDLVAVARGIPQTYGTQWTCDEGRVTLLTPVADPAHLDARRAEAGLPPSDEFAQQFCGAPPGSTDGYIIKREFP